MIILDGGMGQELVKRAGKATDLWSMQALLDMPAVVRQSADNLRWEIATTNTSSGQFSLLIRRATCPNDSICL